MWTNQSVDTASMHDIVVVSRATTANYREAVENHTLHALPYSLTIDRSEKADFIVDTVYDSYWSNTYDWNLKKWVKTYTPSRSVPTKWPNDWMSDNSSSFQLIAGKVNTQISEYSNKRDNRLLKKLKGQSLPLIMAWREREETGHLLFAVANRISDACKVIRHPKQFVRRLYKGYKHRDAVRLKVMERRAQKAYISFLKYRKWPRSRKPRVGDLFLQYEFAWKPLIMDIQDAIDATAETEKHLSGGHVKVGYNQSGTVTSYGGRMTGDELILKCDYKMFGHQKVYWGVDNVALAALSQIQSLPETLWDAMPYSFVVDWFADVGSYLELRNATLGLSFNNGYRSLCVEKHYSSSPNSPRRVESSSLQYVAKTCWPPRYQFSFQRQILTSFPDPHLEIDISMPSSLLHMAEAAALVNQALTRKL